MPIKHLKERKSHYYYKAKNGSGLLSLKSPLKDDNYIEITEEEFNSLKPQPHEPTAAERAAREKKNRISHLKGELARTDYVALKLAEALAKGDASAILEEYADVLASRESWRAEINTLEGELNE